MKSFIYITILLFSISVFAQRPMSKKMKPNLSTEQQAELQSKRIALALDLDSKQLAEVKALQLERAQERLENRKLRDTRRGTAERPSQKELFKINNERLDAQIRHQEKMKKILTKEQYEMWKEIRIKQRLNRQNRQNKIPQNKGGHPRTF